MSTAHRPLPVSTDITAPYWQAAREGRLLIQRCPDCARFQFYPRSLCTRCGSTRIDWAEASGRGTIYTFTINRRAAHPAFRDRVPYVVAIVELEEGVRMMANIIGSPVDAVSLGAAVVVTFEPAGDDITLPQFRLA